MRRRLEVNVALDSVLCSAYCHTDKSAKKQKQTFGCSKRFTSVQHTKHTHNQPSGLVGMFAEWLQWWTWCLVTKQGQCVNVRSGRGWQSQRRKDLLCLCSLKSHEHTLAIIICLTVAKKRLSTPPQCTWSMTVHKTKSTTLSSNNVGKCSDPRRFAS